LCKRTYKDIWHMALHILHKSLSQLALTFGTTTF
jgi:hypothetical protein